MVCLLVAGLLVAGLLVAGLLEGHLYCIRPGGQRILKKLNYIHTVMYHTLCYEDTHTHTLLTRRVQNTYHKIGTRCVKYSVQVSHRVGVYVRMYTA